MNALLDEVEGQKARAGKPQVTMKKFLIDVDLPFPHAVTSGEPPLATPMTKKPPVLTKSDSVVHCGDTDSSDDEENKYFEERTYNDYGNNIRRLLKSKKSFEDSQLSSSPSPKKSPVGNNRIFGLGSIKARENTALPSFDSYKDPIFGISVINPLLSSAMMKYKMTGRTPISFCKLRNHVLYGEIKTDWVLGGVLVNKTPTRISQKGKNYVIWTLSDLKTGLLTAALFLFGRAYEKLWKTQVGAVVGVLNPSILPSQNIEKRSKQKDQAKLSISDPDQVMMIGRSKDLGTCKGMMKGGGDCNAFVNTRECTFCSYHVASAYKDYRCRGELQSPTCGSLKSLKNKILGKNEVFYGGESYVAEPSRSSSTRVLSQDKQRLSNLGATSIRDINPAPNGSLSANQLSARGVSMISLLRKSDDEKPSKTPQAKDAARLNSLDSTTKSTDRSVSSPLPSKLGKKPVISTPDNGIIEFDLPVTKLTAKPAVKQLSARSSFVPRALKVEKKLQTKFSSLVNMKSEPVTSDKAHFSLKYCRQIASNNSCSDKSAPNSGESAENHASHEGAFKRPRRTAIDLLPTDVLLERPPSTINSLPAKGEEAVRAIVKTITRLPSSQRMSNAKLKALQIVKQKGGITRENPRGITRDELVERGLKRHRSETEELDEPSEEMKHSVISQRFIELMKMESKHSDLVKDYDLQQEDKYFERLERKEQMEEKMMNIFKLECKAVRCLKCRYTWFSAADACKADGHPLKVIDALKRFFKCNDCGNRTVSLAVIPLLPCKKCDSTNWVKTAMMKERIVKSNHELSIRGGEQKFVNSVVSNTNVNLLVPE